MKVNGNSVAAAPDAWTTARLTAHELLCRADLEGRPVREVLADYAAGTARPVPGHFGIVLRLVEGTADRRQRMSRFVSAFEEERAITIHGEIRDLALVFLYELLYVRECDDVALFRAAADLDCGTSAQDSSLIGDMLVYVAQHAQR